jgi:hypothetical protein
MGYEKGRYIEDYCFERGNLKIRIGPHWRSMTPVDVVSTLRDDKGAIHWLAVRHQRIAAVE